MALTLQHHFAIVDQAARRSREFQHPVLFVWRYVSACSSHAECHAHLTTLGRHRGVSESGGRMSVDFRLSKITMAADISRGSTCCGVMPRIGRGRWFTRHVFHTALLK